MRSWACPSTPTTPRPRARSRAWEGSRSIAEKVAALRPDLVLAVAEGNAQGTRPRARGRGRCPSRSRRPDRSTPCSRASASSPSGSARPEEGRRLVAELERRRAAVRAAHRGPAEAPHAAARLAGSAAGRGRADLPERPADRGRRATTSSETAAAGRSSPASTSRRRRSSCSSFPTRPRRGRPGTARSRRARSRRGRSRAPAACASTRRS